MKKYYLIILNLNVFLLTGNGQKYSNDLTTAKIIFYYGSNIDHNSAFSLDYSSSILNHPYFDPNKITTLYIHGYQEKQDDESIRTIVTAYNRRHDHNLLVLDWAALANGHYIFESLISVKQLGEKLALILLKMFDLGLNLQRFHVVGHSLGGQMAGIIGRTVIAESNGNIKLPRISALDPAFPGFYVIMLESPISAADAKFVDIIHTDAFIYGAPVPTGTVDFWPNGGITLQPGCVERNFVILSAIDLCSHMRSWKYWAESVSNIYKQKFLAVKFNTWRNFKKNSQYTKQVPVIMGLESSMNLSGMYFLQTNSKTPFARGLDGTVYHHLNLEIVVSKKFYYK